jgi:spermidine/putrescine transport system substrate-binding protein
MIRKVVGKWGFGSVWLVIALVVTGCGGAPAASEPTVSAPRTLTVTSWVDDMPTVVLEAFEQEFGVEVEFIGYEDQDSIVEEIRRGNNRYDVVILGNELVWSLWQEGKLSPLDYNVIQNFVNLDTRFIDLSFDPENQYSVPYNWGTTTILVRSDLVDVQNFADLWSLEADQRIIMWQSMRFTFGSVLKALGYSINTESVSELAAAGEKLMELVPYSIFPDGDTGEIGTPLADGRAVVAMNVGSRDAIAGQEANSNIRWVLPEEGVILWGDNYTIPAGSTNQALAQQFINYMLQPEVNAQVVTWNQYGTPNLPARDLLEPSLRNNVLIFPLQRDMANAEILLPISAEAYAIQQAIWNEFVAAVEAQAQGT